MYAWVFLSEWERQYCRCSQSLNSESTDTRQATSEILCFQALFIAGFMKMCDLYKKQLFLIIENINEELKIFLRASL